MQLINLSVVKYRAEYLARTNLFSHYDAEGRRPVYWYTQLDGGLDWVEENLMMIHMIIGRRPTVDIAKVNYTHTQPDAQRYFLSVGSQRFSA